jgi:hypothetical protein
MSFRKILYKAFTISFISGMVSAQEIDKVVFVKSAFQPIIENAEKMGQMPVLSDTLKPQPEINYSVLPSHIDGKYTIKPIKPASLVGSPLDELYKSRIRLGIGNYVTPLAEFSIHNLRSKDYSVGAYAYHKSSHTNLKLDNKDKVPAGYGINKVSAYGKRFYKDVNVEGEVGFNSHKSRFYGYNTANFIDTFPVLDNKDIRQWYKQLKARAEVYSTTSDSNAVHYRVGVMADYFGDDYSFSQNHVDIPGQLSFMIQSFRVELNARYHFFNSILDTLNTTDYAFQFRPVVSKRTDLWEASVGLNSYLTSYGDANIFPEAHLAVTLIDEAMEVYIGFKGDLELNHFSKIAAENEFIRPGLNIKNTKHKILGYGGIRGQLSSSAGYRLFLQFDSMEDQYFYVNDTSTILENQFVVDYNDVELITLGTELSYGPTSFLDFYLKAKYNSYNLSVDSKPWHKPVYSLTFTTRYNYKEKIFAKIDLIHQGERFAKNFSDLTTPITLKSIWDLNLQLEYKYSKVLSGFVEVHNLLSQQYYVWNQYPEQRINFLLGVSYKF